MRSPAFSGGGSQGWAERLFLGVLDDSLRDAAVTFEVDGRARVVGRVGDQPEVALSVRNPRLFARVLSWGSLGLGEAFMDGDFEMARGELHEFLTILLRNRAEERFHRSLPVRCTAALVRTRNAVLTRAANTRRHYDLGLDLFESFLDPSMTYSCGYARTAGDDLETLQRAKLDRICQKLRLGPGNRVLDVGCGFGGLLLHAAEHYGARGVGITNSRDHASFAARRVRERGLAERVSIVAADFQEASRFGHFDHVVSVGMFEHLPRAAYADFFRVVRGALSARGTGLLHSIGANAPRNDHDPFIQKYIFPGSNQPRLSEITSHLERIGLPILDVENLVRHYGPTVEAWLRAFREKGPALDKGRYDARFRRMWEYYLAGCIAASRASDAALYQVLFTADRALDIPFQRV